MTAVGNARNARIQLGDEIAISVGHQAFVSEGDVNRIDSFRIIRFFGPQSLARRGLRGALRNSAQDHQLRFGQDRQQYGRAGGETQERGRNMELGDDPD